MAVVEVVNRLSCKNKKLMDLLRQLVTICMCHNILFKAKHIPGKHNTIADMLSRFQRDAALEKEHGLAEMPEAIEDSWLPW